MKAVTQTRAVVFDLDDTLYPETQFAFSGFRAVSDTFSARLNVSFDLFERMTALFNTADRPRVFNVIAAELDLSDADAVVAEMIHTFRTHRPTIALFGDADAALRRLAPTHKVGIISDGFLATQTAKIDALGLRERVHEIVLTDEWGRQFWKPHRRAFDEMTHRLDVDHTRCVYVADNPAKDFVAPLDLGWHTVRVRRPTGVYRDAAIAPTGRPHVTITTLDELEDAI